LVAEITQQGGRAIAIRCDTSEEEDCRSAVEQVLAEFGAIDLLVSNAGVASRGKSVLDSDPSEFARLMHVHAFAVHHLCRAALPAMRTRPRSDIILVSSVLTSTFPPNTAPYTMAKAAAEALARVLAREEREHGVHVNIVAPGLVKTEMGRRLVRANLGYQDIDHADADSPFGHVCTPDEVGRVVSFLASCEASYINDQRLVVDGGSF
jgi:NAD(P)-dependent dehydrogenase (short-subunit alcohol dehydrogenase family)